MRLIVISDTHNNYRVLREIVEKHISDSAAFLFLGDGLRELDDIRDEFTHKEFYAVRGNCDMAAREPECRTVMFGDTRIFMSHGHMYGVRGGTDHLLSAAKENSARLALYGHTHVAHSDYEDGIYIFNPGSPTSPRQGAPSYGIIDITSAGIVPIIVRL